MYANKKIAFLGEPKIISYPVKYITAIGGIWKEYYDADIIIMTAAIENLKEIIIHQSLNIYVNY